MNVNHACLRQALVERRRVLSLVVLKASGQKPDERQKSRSFSMNPQDPSLHEGPKLKTRANAMDAAATTLQTQDRLLLEQFVLLIKRQRLLDEKAAISCSRHPWNKSAVVAHV